MKNGIPFIVLAAAGTFLALFLLSNPLYAFTESDFESLVRSENAELKALFEQKEALRSGEEEASLVYGWQFVGGLNRRIDKRPPNNPSFTYDAIETHGYQVGLQKLFSFGLETKLSLGSTQTEIVNGSVGSGVFNAKFWDTQPMLELKLPLLAGGFGRSVRADFQISTYRKRLAALEAEISYESKMNEAKTLFWSTLLQKEHLAVQGESLQRIEKIYQLVSRKAAQNLEASSNFLQTRSALESTQLNLSSLQLRFAQLERLLKLVLKNFAGVQIASYDFQKFKRADLESFRGKVTAQEKLISLSEDLQTQTALLTQEVNRSRLDLVGSTSLTGQDPSWSESLGQIQRGRYPTNFLGVQWVLPLDRRTLNRAIERQEILARTAMAKKRYYQNEQKETLVQDLVAQHNQMVEMLALNLRLEKTQAEKLRNERQLLSQGRSSIYQVLQFELDLSRAYAGKFALAIDLEKSQQQLSQYRYNSYE